jgi:PAS domain S-box-containing protein
VIDQMAQTTGQYDILIVDDARDSLELLNRILEERRYRVRLATSGRLALKSVAAKLPDLILLDVKMPEMDGYEVCRRLKSNAHSRNVPVLFISAHGETAKKVEGFKAGGVDFITKPFEREEVLARVETQLRLHDLTEHLEQQVDQRTQELRREILAREQAQEQLRESEKRYSEIVEGTDNLITEVDVEGRFVFVNEAARKVFGLPPKACIGRSAFDFIHPDDRGKTYQSFLQWIEDKKSSVTFENRQVSRSDKVTDMHWTINLHFDDQGHITSIKSIARDVTEQKKAQAALAREAEINLATAELSRNLLSSASIDHIAFLVLEQAKRLTVSAFGYVGHIDPETGYLVCPTLTRDIWDTCAVADKDIVFKKFTGLWGWVLKNRKPLLINEPADDPRSSGTPPGHVPIHCFLSAPALIGETLVGQVSVANADHDYTDRELKVIERLANLYAIAIQRRQAEEDIKKYRNQLEERVKERTAKLETTNKELEAFAYSVSHDLQAPLRHIDGFLELLQKKAEPALDKESLHYMDAIANAAQGMGKLIDDLLSFSRMGRHAVTIQSVDLGNLLREVIGELEPEAAGRNITWRIGALPAVDGDAAMLRIVLSNLIANALKFTRPRQQARIEIGALPGQGAEALIFVRDNGVGFDMAYADKLFGVFQRLHRAEEFEGTGIGLANVRRIIARHGGRTWAEAKVEQGATFYFALPRVKGGAQRPGQC